MSTLSRREDLRSSVTQLLESARDGHLPDTRETQSIDFKEEAGRRNGSQIEPGEKENPEAATKLAEPRRRLLINSGKLWPRGFAHTGPGIPLFSPSLPH